MRYQNSSLDFTEEKPPDKAGKEGQAYALHHNKRCRNLHSAGGLDRVLAAAGCTAGGYVLHSYIYPAGGGS